MAKTLVVNMFGGPGAGKSTLAKDTVTALCKKGIIAEFMSEVAKDLVWDKRYRELNLQPYVFGEQLNRLERVVGQVDVAVTESPILLSAIYQDTKWPLSFRQGIVEIFKRYNNLNIFVVRNHQYVSVGRRGSEQSAIEVDEKIQKFLLDNGEDCSRIVTGEGAVGKVLELVESVRKNEKST